MTPATILVATGLVCAQTNSGAPAAATPEQPPGAASGSPAGDLQGSALPEVPSGDTQAGAPTRETVLSGYLDERLTGQYVHGGDLLPASTVPRFLNVTEANVQVKLRWGERGLVLGDASFFYQLAAGFGDEPAPPTTEPPSAGFAGSAAASYLPAAVISELYGSYSPAEQINFTLGKKRVVWGPGIFTNPTDLLNPAKDPTDPSQQRVGAWLARMELPYEQLTLSLVFAARVLREVGGVPAALLYYPGGDPADDGQAHLAAAARLYLLVADTDINLIYYYTNRYDDLFENKSRFGLTLSRLLGKSLEVHVEGLGQLGTHQPYVDSGCYASPADLSTCATARSLVTYPGLRSSEPAVRLVLGGTYTFDDDSSISLEYALYSDVYESSWRGLLQGLALTRDRLIPADLLTLGGNPSSSAPQAFVFESLRRQYLFGMYTKPRINDDFTFSFTLIGSVEDLSTQLAPQLTWSATESLTLKLQLFVPTPPIFPTEVLGGRYGEMNLSPTDWRVLLSGRLFY